MTPRTVLYGERISPAVQVERRRLVVVVYNYRSVFTRKFGRRCLLPRFPVERLPYRERECAENYNRSSRTGLKKRMFSNVNFHGTQSDWALTALVWLQPIKSWRRRTPSSFHLPNTTTVCTSTSMGNESVPKIIINDAINSFFQTAISILAISNHNSFSSAVW